MPLDPERLAADVVQVIKAAIAPVTARLSKCEATLSTIPAPDATLPGRLAALETKAVVIPSAVLAAALAPVMERVATVEATLATVPQSDPSMAPDDLAASFTGMLRKELDALDPPRTQKRVERDEHGNVVRVIEEPVTE